MLSSVIVLSRIQITLYLAPSGTTVSVIFSPTFGLCVLSLTPLNPCGGVWVGCVAGGFVGFCGGFCVGFWGGFWGGGGGGTGAGMFPVVRNWLIMYPVFLSIRI